MPPARQPVVQMRATRIKWNFAMQFPFKYRCDDIVKVQIAIK